MGVGVDQDRHARLRRGSGVDLVEVAAVGVCVDLEHRAGANARLEHGLEVELVWRSLLDLAPAEVADAVDVGALDGADDAGGHRLGAHPEGRVDARDDPVELRQQLVGIIQRPVGEDVDLRPRQQPQPGYLSRADQLDLAQ